MPIRLEKRRSETIPLLGVSLCTSALKNAAFGKEAKSKKTLK